jgi:hypothetical protein
METSEQRRLSTRSMQVHKEEELSIALSTSRRTGSMLRGKKTRRAFRASSARSTQEHTAGCSSAGDDEAEGR